MKELDTPTLRSAQRGERAAQEALVVRHQDAVFGVVGRIVFPNTARVEDLAQETFLKVLRALPRFDPAGPAKLSTWILTIATRTAIDSLRTDPGRRMAAWSEAEELSSPTDPEREFDQRRALARVEEEMANLPADHRAVLVLRGLFDLDYPEIAEALAIEVGTVKSRLARARLALRRAIPEVQHD